MEFDSSLCDLDQCNKCQRYVSKYSDIVIKAPECDQEGSIAVLFQISDSNKNKIKKTVTGTISLHIHSLGFELFGSSENFKQYEVK